MRRVAWITIALVALVAAGAALAHGFDTKSVKAVSATFTATTASNVRTSTCTGSDGTYVTTHGTYTGTATGDPTLSGAVTIDADSLINSTTNVGTVNGRIRIDVSGGTAGASFTAVYANGTLVGLAVGHAGGSAYAALIANVSAGFSGSGGFSSGMIGGGSSAGSAVELSSGGCRPTPPPRPDKIRVRGTVSAVSTSSITAAGVTCANSSSSLAAQLANVHAGDQVEMTCLVSGGTTTLASLSGGHRHGDDH
jgi:hypothetical protein